MTTDEGIQYDICRTQEDIYKWAAAHKYDMPRFSAAYLSSSFCFRVMDALYSRFQLEAPNECFDFITPEIGTFESNAYFDEEVAGWIGWMYRFLCFKTGRASKYLCEKVSFNDMCLYYPGLHTIDELMAVDIICHDHNIESAPTE